MNTLLRYLEMLRHIPKEPDSISTADLLRKLEDQGYQVDIRTVQRDLQKLSGSGLFPLTNFESNKHYYWFWPKHMTRMQFPIMSADEALTFKLVEQFLLPLLPLSVKEQLAGYFSRADSTLQVSPLVNWPDKVRIIPNNQSLLPAQIDSGILLVVYEALLKNRRFTASYRRRGRIDDQVKSYEVNPLGLIFKDSIVYLVATLWDYQQIRQLALHRFQTAALSEQTATVPDGFSLDAYIAEGEFDYPTVSGCSIDISLKIQSWLYKQLTETPLSQNQSITAIDNNTYQLQATVKDTRQLRWWLKSLGVDVEILTPQSLREEFANDAETLRQIYHGSLETGC